MDKSAQSRLAIPISSNCRKPQFKLINQYIWNVYYQSVVSIQNNKITNTDEPISTSEKYIANERELYRNGIQMEIA